MMGTELVAIEKQLNLLSPQFAQVLGKTMPVERLIRTAVSAIDRNPDLLKCDRQSLFNAAMTFAVLGLEVDGVTGQGFLIPFKGHVQPVIGYLGYNTLAARAGMTITGRVVRDGDALEFDEAAAVVRHSRKLGGETGPEKRRIVAAWARAASLNRPAVLRVLSADELLAVKAKSPRGNYPPWSDPEIGYPAMCEKTAKRRLRRDMPLSVYQQAARMEEAHEEEGAHTWIHPDRGVVVEGEIIAPDHDRTPTATELMNPPNLLEEAETVAESGREIFRVFWKRLNASQRAQLQPHIEKLKSIVDGAESAPPSEDK